MVLNNVVYLDESDKVVGGGVLEEVASVNKPGGDIGAFVLPVAPPSLMMGPVQD